MPWKDHSVSQVRLGFAHAVRSAGVPVVEACRRFGISRKTGYKWLARFDAQTVAGLEDHSRRPLHSPRRTDAPIEGMILAARDRFGWGGRKIRAYLIHHGHSASSLPSARTTQAILARHGKVHPTTDATPKPLECFERSAPHDLWQADHKGAIEVARKDTFPLVVVDDHSRYLIALHPCHDKSMALAWNVFWNAFGEFGLPKSVLTDNAFGTTFDVPKTLSWFESQLVRLRIDSIHGRPYHPQTQGKVERFNGTLEREMLPRARTDQPQHFATDAAAFRELYNHTRPHEALGDKPPVSRFAKSPRERPDTLPEADSFYPAGSELRKVASSGDIRWAGSRILAGRGLVGQTVRLEEREHELAVFYCWKQIRAIPRERLGLNGML